MSFFNVRVIGTEELYRDLREEVKKINSRIPNALNRVGSEMIYNLQEHIQKDFYDAYEPKEYERRRENPEHGLSMMERESYFTEIHGKTMVFHYIPNTSHKLYETWDRFPLPRDPDDLIEWAQHSHSMGHSMIPARPFWNNFVNDQLNGRIISNFGAGMRPFYRVLAEGGENDVVADGDELMPAEYMEELPF